MRLRVVPVVCLLALCASPPAGADYIGSLRLPQGTPPAAAPVPYDLANPRPVNSSWAEAGYRPLGVTLDNYELTAAQIDAVSQTGCGLVRLSIPVEPFGAALDAAGQPLLNSGADWLALDQVISRLRRVNLEILPVLTASAPPAPISFERLCTALAQRYGPSFKYYQILDNVNFSAGLTSERYGALVAIARKAITAADPDAVMVCGGIRGCDITYLDLLAANGALRQIDVLAFNLYPPSDGIEQVAGHGMRAHSLPFMEEVLGWAKQHGKPVWVTSLGVPTSFQDPTGVGVDQVAQASEYARAAILLGYMGVLRIIYASIQDTDPSYLDPARCLGLLDVTGTPKASFYALKALAGLVTAAYQVIPQFSVESSTYARYSERDLFNAADSMAVPEADPLSEFQVYQLPVYAFWLYNAEHREYRLVYWLASTAPLQHLITLTVYEPAMTPTEEFQLLDTTPAQVKGMQGQNLVSVQYLPLDAMPTVLRFEVRPHGRRH